MGFFHNDTHSIAHHYYLSIPDVSDGHGALPYYPWMENDSWKNWGPRFKALAKENGETLATVAEKMGLTEAALRHWTNGTREINLTDFIEMCSVAGVHPSLVLFDGPPMDPDTKRQIGDLAKKLDADIGPMPDFKKTSKLPRPKPRA